MQYSTEYQKNGALLDLFLVTYVLFITFRFANKTS